MRRMLKIKSIFHFLLGLVSMEKHAYCGQFANWRNLKDYLTMAFWAEPSKPSFCKFSTFVKCQGESLGNSDLILIVNS